MKKNNLILGTFLAITAILFSSFGASSASNSPSTEKIDGSTEITESGGVVTIGSQVWTSKNLDVATYRNGDIIPQVQDQEAWEELKTGAWCYYNNDPANGTKYGKLYNWYAVNDARGLAPQGYHIPSDAEWDTLEAYLGGGFWSGKDAAAGTKMKSSSGWNSYTTGGSKTCPNCASWNDEYRKKVACHTCKDTREVPSPKVTHSGNGTNSSGFSGLPGGSNGYYSLGYMARNVRSHAYWWSSTGDRRAWARGLQSSTYCLGATDLAKFTGCSVRCIRD